MKRKRIKTQGEDVQEMLENLAVEEMQSDCDCLEDQLELLLNEKEI